MLATLVTFILGGWTPSAVSVGAQMPCEHKGVSQVDLDKVRAPASRNAAGHRLDWRSVQGCRHSRGAWVHIDIIDEPQADGSVITGATLCDRAKLGNWECEYYSGRQFQMTVKIAGQPRRVWTTIPAKISVEAVTRMMQQAIDVAPGLTMAEVCSLPTKVDPNTHPSWLAALEEIHHDFQFADDPPYAHITDWGTHLTVQVGENNLDFEPAQGGADGYEFSCWTISFHV